MGFPWNECRIREEYENILNDWVKKIMPICWWFELFSEMINPETILIHGNRFIVKYWEMVLEMNEDFYLYKFYNSLLNS